jgi:hypothetical protein
MLKQPMVPASNPGRLKPRKLEKNFPLASVEAALDVDNLTNRLRNHAAAQQFGIFRKHGSCVIKFASPSNTYPTMSFPQTS